MSLLTNNTQSAPGVYFFLRNPVPYLSVAPSNSDVPTRQAGQVILTNVGGNLYVNGSVVGTSSNWSLFPAISNTIYMDASNTITNIGSNLYFDGNLIANASDISNVGDWALYNAVADVKLSNAGSNYSITGARNITAISNVSAGSVTSSGNVSGTLGTFTTGVISPFHSNSGNLVLTCGSNLSLYATSNITSSAPTISNTFNNSYNIFGDKGSDYTDFCYTNISNKGGKGGSINFVADGGQVNIGGTNYGIGGQINLTANSPLVFPYNLTSAIKLSAASVLSYAGAVTPLGSLAGYNYIQGTLGVNIVAGSVSSIPNTAGTVYLYGANGTKLQNSLYVDAISNYPGSNLNIHPDNSQWTDMTRVQYIGMGNNPVINGGGGSTSFISNFAGVSASNIVASTGGLFPSISGNSLTSINVPFVAGSDLTLTASQFVGLSVTCNYNVNVNASSNINLNPSNGGVVSVNGTLNMSGSNILGSNLTVSTSGNLTLTSSTGGATYFNNTNVYINNGNLNMQNNSVGGVNRLVFNSGAELSNDAGNIRLVSGNLNMNGATICNVGNILGSNLTVSTGGNLTLTSSTGGAILMSNTVGVYGTMYMNSHTIEQIAGLYFDYGGNMNAFTAGGTNYLDINAPSSNVSGVGNLRFLFAGGNIILDSNINFNGNGSNYVSMNSGGAGIQIAPDNNLYFTGNGSSKFANFQETNVSFNTGTAGSLSIYMNSNAIRNVGTFTRNLGSTAVAQPVIQYGTATGSGSSGSVSVTIPTAYTSSSSYVVQVTMRDSPTAQLYATPTASNTFTIGWSSAGAGTQNIMWTTFGT